MSAEPFIPTMDIATVIPVASAILTFCGTVVYLGCTFTHRPSNALYGIGMLVIGGLLALINVIWIVPGRSDGSLFDLRYLSFVVTLASLACMMVGAFVSASDWWIEKVKTNIR